MQWVSDKELNEASPSPRPVPGSWAGGRAGDLMATTGPFSSPHSTRGQKKKKRAGGQIFLEGPRSLLSGQCGKTQV